MDDATLASFVGSSKNGMISSKHQWCENEGGDEGGDYNRMKVVIITSLRQLKWSEDPLKVHLKKKIL